MRYDKDLDTYFADEGKCFVRKGDECPEYGIQDICIGKNDDISNWLEVDMPQDGQPEGT